MVRWLVLVTALTGTALGLGWPYGTEGNVTGRIFEVWYNIPSGSSGQSPVLNQNWHGGYCPTPPGDLCALDWAPTDSARRIEFRGAFKLSGSADYALHTHQNPSVVNHPDYCDEFTVDLHENHLEFNHGHGNNAPRWGIHYLHGHLLSGLPYAFSIYSVPSGFGYYNSFHVGTIMNTSDAGRFCIWTGPHVHDEMWLGPPPAGLLGYNKRQGFFQVGTPYQHNVHWTRYSAWGEGAYP